MLHTNWRQGKGDRKEKEQSLNFGMHEYSKSPPPPQSNPTFWTLCRNRYVTCMYVRIRTRALSCSATSVHASACRFRRKFCVDVSYDKLTCTIECDFLLMSLMSNGVSHHNNIITVYAMCAYIMATMWLMVRESDKLMSLSDHTSINLNPSNRSVWLYLWA